MTLSQTCLRRDEQRDADASNPTLQVITIKPVDAPETVSEGSNQGSFERDLRSHF